MDIISLSKSNKMIKEAKAYHQKFLGEEVEAHFSSLDERLDWLEGQYSNSSAKEIYNLIVSDAVFDNTEIVGGVLKLKKTDLDHPTSKEDYARKGTYEKTFDMTTNFINTLTMKVLTTVASKQSILVEFDTSNDGLTYTGYSTYNPANPPSARFIKMRLTLTSNDQITITYDANITLEINDAITNNELLKSDSKDMAIDHSWTNEGSLHHKKITRDEWLRIDRVDVN